MRTARTSALAFLFVLTITLASLATFLAADSPTSADATGSWKWTIKTPDGDSIDMSAKLKQDGTKLAGTFLDGFDQKTFDIKNGKVSDHDVTFTVTRPFNDDTITVNYAGKLDGDTIKGTLEVKFGDQDPIKNDWEAKRTTDNSPATTEPTTQP